MARIRLGAFLVRIGIGLRNQFMTDTTIIAREMLVPPTTTAKTAADIPAWLPVPAKDGAPTAEPETSDENCGCCHERVVCPCTQRALNASARRETMAWLILALSGGAVVLYAALQFLGSL
jgi:hypothetical protein